jgi:hypothetical protein
MRLRAGDENPALVSPQRFSSDLPIMKQYNLRRDFMKIHLITSAMFIFAVIAVVSIVSATEINATILQPDSPDYKSLILNFIVIPRCLHRG